MKIYTVHPHLFGANTYLVTADDRTAIVVDPAQPRVAAEAVKRGLLPVCVLLTHCHFDHVGGVEALRAQGAKVLCSAEEKPLTCTQADMSHAFGAPQAQYAVDDVFADGEEKNVCGIRVRAILTPGHTKGSVCYLFEHGNERALFTGDTLFAGNVGRCDLLTGSTEDLRCSLRKLSALPDIDVYPGHGERTTLAEEKRTNPFLQDI